MEAAPGHPAGLPKTPASGFKGKAAVHVHLPGWSTGSQAGGSPPVGTRACSRQQCATLRSRPQRPATIRVHIPRKAGVTGSPPPAVPSRTAARAPARTRQQPQPAPTRTGPHFHAARPSPDEIATMVIAVPFVVKGWHAPAGRRTREPRPLPRPGRSDRQRRWVPGTGTRPASR